MRKIGWVGIVLLLLTVVAANPVDFDVERALTDRDKVDVIVILHDDVPKDLLPEVRGEVLGRLEGSTSPSPDSPSSDSPSSDSSSSASPSSDSSSSDSSSSDSSSSATQSKTPEFILARDLSIGFSGEVSEEGLAKLKKDPRVKKVVLDTIYETTLDVSIPNINANDAWNLSVGGYNITGAGETICMIDTGIDTDHDAFKDKILDQHCFCSLKNADGFSCCPDDTSEDDSAEDDHGHGTHTAGTAAGNLTTYTGVAKDAKIVAIKVCNSSGSCSSSDVISAIDRCVDNATVFNISVISISIGGGGPHTTYCNGDAVAPSVNAAVGKNISVVISAGNNGFTTGISSPACIQNATPVGAVNDADVIAHNRGSILDLLAPGSGIVAPYFGGGTASLSGTSMSTPHVGGAAILFNQYYRLAYNLIPKPAEIEQKMVLTGAFIDDSTGSGRNYSRLDVMAALRPYINYTTSNPQNNSIIKANNTFINVTSDVNLTNAYLEWHYNNGSVVNISMTLQNNTAFNLNLTHLKEGRDFYQVWGNDSVNTFGFSVFRNITIDFTKPRVNVTNPANSSNFTTGLQSFNATMTDLFPDTVLFSFDNATGNGFNISPSNNSGHWHVNVNLSKFVDGQHLMTVLANDSANNKNETVTVQFTIDTTGPGVTFVTSANFTTGNQTFNTTIIDSFSNVDVVRFSFDNASGTPFNVTANNQSGNWVVIYNVSTLAPGEHALTVFSNDTLGNVNMSEVLNFVVDNTPPAVIFVTPASGSSFNFESFNQTFNLTVIDLNLTISSVVFSFDNSSGTGFNVTAVNQSGNWVASYNVSTLASGTNEVRVFANDTLGNMNATQNITFTVDLTTPVVTLNSPVDQFNSTSSVTFNCSAKDDTTLANLTLYGNWTGWHANQTKAVNGSSNESTFSKTIVDGTYLWNCLAGDVDGNFGFSSANRTVIVDSVAPTISSVASGSLSTSGATITWTSGELSNSTVEYGTSAALGTFSSSLTQVTSHSIVLSSLSDSTEYFYNVTSCDAAGNCNTSGANTFTTTAESSDSGSSSSSSSSGGGGATAATTAATEEVAAEEPAPVISTGGATGGEEVEEIEEAEPEPERTSTTLLTKGEEKSIFFSRADLAITQIRITSKVDKEVNVVAKVSSEPEVSLGHTFQYIDISVDLTEEEIDEAWVKFTVPQSWFEEGNYNPKSLKFHVLEEEWRDLRTKLIDNDGDPLVYEAKIPHFSTFAIAAKPATNLFGGAIGLVTSWLPTSFGIKAWVLLGIVLVILILVVLYFVFREKDPYSQ